MHLNAKVLQVSLTRKDFRIRHVLRGESKRIHRRRRNQIGVPDRQHLRIVCLSGGCSDFQQCVPGRVCRRRRLVVTLCEVAREYRVRFAPIVVRSRDHLMLVDAGRISRRDSSAWIETRCIRIPRPDLPRDRTNQGRIQTVIHERRAQRDLTARITLRRCGSGEIAGKHCRRRYDQRSRLRIGPRKGSLIASEEEQFVLHNRPAEHASELVAFQGIAPGRKGIPRIEDSIANEFEQIAVEIIAAALGYHADCAGSMKTKTRRCRTGFEFELLQRVGEWNGQRHISLGIHVPDAIKLIQQAEQ